MQGCFICFNISNGVSLLEIISQRVSGKAPDSLKYSLCFSRDLNTQSSLENNTRGIDDQEESGH